MKDTEKGVITAASLQSYWRRIGRQAVAAVLVPNWPKLRCSS